VRAAYLLIVLRRLLLAPDSHVRFEMRHAPAPIYAESLYDEQQAPMTQREIFCYRFEQRWPRVSLKSASAFTPDDDARVDIRLYARHATRRHYALSQKRADYAPQTRASA
jgi:hypothetical protein